MGTTATYTVSGMTCGHCVMSVTEEVTETAPAELTVNVTVRRRELATGASAEATIRVGDRTIFASWSHSAPTRTEAQSPGSERFSETTLDDQRGAAAGSCARATSGPASTNPASATPDTTT